MKYRAMIKDGWWIGWLIDLPGVNAQERTREELMHSLSIGAQDLLESEVDFEAEVQMVVVKVPDPDWAGNSGESLVAEGHS